MAVNPIYQGSPTLTERIAAETDVFRAVARGVSYDLRVAMPGIIQTFDPATQLCTVQIAVADKLFLNNQWTDVTIPTLQDVVLLLPGDTDWCVTFPSPVGSECLVVLTDFCINSWLANGGTLNTQECDRRHDYSDAFAILAPRSRPKAIPNYSTTQMQIRAIDSDTVISLDEDNAIVKATKVTLQGVLNLAGSSPSATSGDPTFALPVEINGTTYYLQLKATP